MTPLWVEGLDVVASTVHMIVPGAYVIRVLTNAWMGGRTPPIVNTVFFELRPFYLPAVFIEAAINLAAGDWTWVNPIFLAISVLNWWLWRNEKDDDDRWKRRRESSPRRWKPWAGNSPSYR